MKTVLRWFGLGLSLCVVACVTVPPGQEDDEDVEEAEAALYEPCMVLCDCALGTLCYNPTGQGGICIPDMFGPPDPAICYSDCQCPSGTQCDPTMHCAVPACTSHCDCPAGDVCAYGQCIDDIFTPWSQCSADCQCGAGQTCQNHLCTWGGGTGYEQPR